MEEKGICLTCNNAEGCLYRKPDSVIVDCDEFDDEIEHASRKS